MTRLDAVRAAAVATMLLVATACGGGAETEPTPAETGMVATAEASGSAEAPEPSTEENGETEETGDADEGDVDVVVALPDACELLTPAQIETVTGDALEPGAFDAAMSSDEQGVCHFAPAEEPFPIVQVIVIQGVGAGFDLQLATAADLMGDDVADISIPGASQAFAAANGSVIGMAVGDTYLQVAYLSTSTEDVTAITSELAELAAAAL